VRAGAAEKLDDARRDYEQLDRVQEGEGGSALPAA
jgi:hypothetical protein